MRGPAQGLELAGRLLAVVQGPSWDSVSTACGASVPAPSPIKLWSRDLQLSPWTSPNLSTWGHNPTRGSDYSGGAGRACRTGPLHSVPKSRTSHGIRSEDGHPCFSLGHLQPCFFSLFLSGFYAFTNVMTFLKFRVGEV